MRKFNNKFGFTIPEILVVSLILGIAALFFFQFISNLNTNTAPTLTNRLVLQMNGRNIADQILDKIRQSSAIIRPIPGETTPFMLLRDARNQICFFYLVHDSNGSKKFKKPLCLMNFHEENYKKDKSPTKKIGDCIESVKFTGVSGRCVQLNLKLANDKNCFQFLSQASLMSLGESDES
ncbi:MAG: PilW family protein [Candidatus Rifleibacteriota bacterium]